MTMPNLLWYRDIKHSDNTLSYIMAIDTCKYLITTLSESFISSTTFGLAWDQYTCSTEISIEKMYKFAYARTVTRPCPTSFDIVTLWHYLTLWQLTLVSTWLLICSESFISSTTFGLAWDQYTCKLKCLDTYTPSLIHTPKHTHTHSPPSTASQHGPEASM